MNINSKVRGGITAGSLRLCKTSKQKKTFSIEIIIEREVQTERIGKDIIEFIT